MPSDVVKAALIGLVGTVGGAAAGAAISNWDRIFSGQDIMLNEQNVQEGKTYKFTAIALPEVSGKCQDAKNRLWFGHWCFIVSKTQRAD